MRKKIIIASCFAVPILVMLCGYFFAMPPFPEHAIRLPTPAITPPPQPITATQQCGARPIRRVPYLIEVRLPPVDVLPCYTNNDYFYTVIAQPAELRTVVRRPVVSLRVDRFGKVRHLRLVRGSGNAALDKRALQVISRKVHHENYCRCGATTAINIDWNGPLWFRE